jgi:lipoprotein-anchoring transpeptidase ErfK/SrfK
MIAAGSIRPVLVGAQVIVTFVGANVGGAFAAIAYQNQQVQSAMTSIDAAQKAFDAQVNQSLADGTPRPAVDLLVKQEKVVLTQALPGSTSFIDRRRLDALKARVARLGDLKKQVAGVETQLEVDLHGQLHAALDAMAADVKPASAAGVETADYQRFVDDTDKSNQGLKIPGETQKVIDTVKAKDAALKDATIRKVAANQALQSAQADAKKSVAGAQTALQAAQAIPVLKVTDAAFAISALAGRLASASGLADFQDIAAGAKTQSYALNNLLSTRQSANDLLNTTRDHIGLAQKANKDVSQDVANLDVAAKQLDVAGDLVSIQAAKAAIQAVKNSVDSKYWQAIYGSGKVIVVSVLKQELMALQDGVVLQDTVVTTGRPALPTPPGLYHIFYKSSPYHMHSPWPPGNKYWYPDVDMKYAMEFIDGGYFLHDAPWRTHFGPGSDSENGGTHGCINVPNGPMGWLYPWADMGTTVVVLAGDFGSGP